MIKTNLICLSIISSLSFNVRAETSNDLYKKVFGKNQEAQKITIDATMGDFYLGPLSATILGEKVLSVSGSDLEKLLIEKIRSEKKAFYKLDSGDVDPSKLPFKIKYIASELRLSLIIPPSDLEPLTANVFDDIIPYYSRNSNEPAPFSLGTNYKLEKIWTKKIEQRDSLSTQLDTFANIKRVTVENQMNYLSTRSLPWYRQNTRLNFDRHERMQKIELGDVNYPIIGYQQNKSLGGLSFYKDYSLNPYRSSAPTASFEYEIESRSLVRTLVNNAVIKTEYMNPGRYSIKDIPLNNGLNKIIVEATDEFGKKKVFVFNEASSLDSLGAGLKRYSLAAGLPSTDTETQKKYDNANGTFYTGFYQYGVNRTWSAAAYLQGNKNYNLYGLNNIFSTSIGNWSLDTVATKNQVHSAPAILGNYQLNLFGVNWYDSHTLNARLEYRAPWFNENGDSIINRYDTIFTTSYSVPFLEMFNVSLGGNYQHPRAEDAPKFGFESSFTTKIINSSSLTFYYARSRDESKTWGTQLYLFLNFTFGESSTYASAFYEKNSDTKRLTLINDNGKKLNDLKIASSIDQNSSLQNGSLDLQYNTNLADLGVREEIIHAKGADTGTKTSLRLLSAFAFVTDGSESAFSLSRPIANSFVIFKPSKGWAGQKFGVQSSSNDNDTETGLFGESLISGLTPYQYKRLQLDPSHLQPGYSLGQESFVVFPHYRSGHLFVIGKAGLLVLKGIMLDQSKKPIPLKVGYWTSVTGKTTAFFTGRNGEFYIEGVEPSLGKIQLDDETYKESELNLSDKKSGLIDIGAIVVPYGEGRL